MKTHKERVESLNVETQKHTQGKWMLYKKSYDNKTFIGVTSTDDNGATHVIANMDNYDPSDNDKEHKWTKTAEANAKLIAVSPAMLETLEQVMRYLKGKESLTIMESVGEKILQAINKATE